MDLTFQRASVRVIFGVVLVVHTLGVFAATPPSISAGEMFRTKAESSELSPENLISAYENFMFVEDCFNLRKGYTKQYVDLSSFDRARSGMKRKEAEFKRTSPAISTQELWKKADVNYRSGIAEIFEIAKLSPQSFLPDLHFLCMGAVAEFTKAEREMPREKRF